MSRRWDVVVIGGGTNGLAAATAIARAGRSVLLVEQRSELGGLAAGEEFHSGYRSAGVLQDTATVRPWVVEELELGKHGLRRAPTPALLVPQAAGEGLVLRPDGEGVPGGDQRRYSEYRAFLAVVSAVLRRLADRPPPDFLEPRWRDLLALGLGGLALRRLGRGTMSELLRVAPTCVADWLDEWFDDELLKAALAAPALWASRTGPQSPGTTAGLLRRAALAEEPVLGGPAALATALARAARAAGVEIRTDCRVDSLLLAGGAAAGVRLADGEEVAATAVAASCDPKQLFLGLLPPAARSRALTRDVLNYRARGSTAVMDLALRDYPEFARHAGRRFEAIRVGESLDELERAFDAVKYRRISERPLLEIHVPTVHNPELAPPGHHVFSMLVHFVPHEIEGGWREEQRQVLADRVLVRLREVVPAIDECLVAHRVLTPVDLEQRYGLSGGHLYHGEHGLDQLFVRPTPQCARYATPVPRLFLCGAGSHPGGGLTCAPGALGAQAILRHL